MTHAVFIAGDWGTSSLRLTLCDGSGTALARCEGPGIARLKETPAATFGALVAPWNAAHGILPAVLCGMVGSTIGWREVAYAACPVRCDHLAGSALRFTDAGREIVLLPGLSCRGPQGMPDVIRGEETQIAGTLRLQPQLAHGRHLLCLPGTHSKWVLLSDGAVLQFQTALTGELYDLLCRHSVLLAGATPQPDEAGFKMGIAAARTEPQGGLLHLLFTTRSRQLAGELGKDQAGAYFSGLVIGQDIAGALRLFGSEMESPVTLVSAPALTARYAQAFAAFGIAANPVDGEAASLAGLTMAHDFCFPDAR